MKKLMITSALVGSLFAGAASAQTAVSGNLGISYFATTNASENNAKNIGTFGRESQINISNKGKLNNGLDYVAGFSLEFDGGDNTGNADATFTKANSVGQQQENVYIDFINGNTTISVGVDHFQNTDTHITNLVGFGYIGADGVNNAASIYPTSNTTFYGNWGVGVAQKAMGGQFGLYYSPQMSNTATTDIGNTLTSAAQVDNNGGYELTYIGSLGVQGLNVVAGYARADSPTQGAKIGGDRIGVKYNLGALTFAFDDATAKVANTRDTDGRSYGVAYAINKEVSVGVTYGEATREGSKDEETVLVALGYNLGPVTVQAQHKIAQNVGGSAANDGEITGIYLGTRF
jgi:hypothetical protein